MMTEGAKRFAPFCAAEQHPAHNVPGLAAGLNEAPSATESPRVCQRAAMPLKTRITEDMKTAMRGRDTGRLSVIRMLLAGIKQREIDERKELSDAEILAVIDKMVKQRNDSIVQFEAGKRADLVAAEKAEIVVLREYRPAQLTQAELDILIADAIRETRVAGAAGIGKVMAALKPQLTGRADMALVSAAVKARLTG